MAKRFTDTEKWKKPFIRELTSENKLLWMYIVDDCDIAGLWQVDFEIAEIRLGIKINRNEVLEIFKDKIIEIDRGTKWFIPSFIEFQYGSQLSRANNIFKSIDKIMSKYDLYDYLDVDIVDSGTTVSSYRGRLSTKAKDSIYLDSEFICQYCSEQKPKAELVVDHFIPLSKGGDNSDENLICSCVRCNSHKTDTMPNDFFSKNLHFLNPTEKIIKLLKAPFNLLKGDNSTLLGAKDKDKDKDMDKDKDKEKEYLSKKIAKKIDLKVKPESEFPEYKESMEAYHNFYKSRTGVNPSIKAQDGKALKDLILHFRQMATNGNTVLDGLLYVFNHWQKLDDFTQKQIDISKIYTNINSIISQLKSKKKNGNTNTGNTDYESAEFRDSMFAKIDKAFGSKQPD